ncbi:hypothetical protein QFC22_004770 [Naganishia vaughanmartiniae]|uniref:Uncharacterized protein n=1 Tax=Naganishia vaughanmartiniae TaxID=1424756 RepID=A0ACC2WYC6_9TREE|nr:hypothetical protein QFC22_004770 [Naganishia vaughanmartiniae]
MFVKPSVKPAVKSTTSEPTGIPFLDQHIDDIARSLDAIRLKEEKKKNKKARQKANKADLNLQTATLQSVPSSNLQYFPATLLSLPAKLLKHIAGIVRETDIESLASLNVCSKTLYATSLPILWKEVTWRKDTWEHIKSRSTGDPAGWQFTQYIHFSGKAPWFWKGLVDTLSEEEVNLGSEEIVQRRWPELKAVVRTEALMNVEVPKSVWLTVEGAENQEGRANSPVAHGIRMAYTSWGTANSSPAIIPKFVTHFQPVEESFEKAYMAFKTGPESLGRKRPDTHNRPATTLHDFQSDPDATLEVDTVRVKRTLDFYILSSLRRADPLDNQTDRIGHLGVIFHIFSQVQQYFAPATLTFAAERSRTYLGVMVWLQMVCT